MGWFETYSVVNGIAQPLFAAEISFRCFHAHMSKQELNLLEFATRLVAEPRTGTPEIVRCNARRFTPSLSFDAANAGTVTRPNRSCDGSLSSRTLQRYFDTSCFAAGASYVFGNSGRNVLRAPGVDNLDVSVQRDFRMPLERETILATVSGATYGVITSTSTDNRQLQFGIRVTF